LQPRSQSRHTIKISDKLADIDRESGSEADLNNQGSIERSKGAVKRFVKVINTLNPSHESASAFTRKTKLPGKVRSAYQSNISFSHKMEEQSNEKHNLTFALGRDTTGRQILPLLKPEEESSNDRHVSINGV